MVAVGRRGSGGVAGCIRGHVPSCGGDGGCDRGPGSRSSLPAVAALIVDGAAATTWPVGFQDGLWEGVDGRRWMEGETWGGDDSDRTEGRHGGREGGR